MTLEFGSTEANKILERDKNAERNKVRIVELRAEITQFQELLQDRKDEIEHLRDEQYAYERQLRAVQTELKGLT